ncbi:hypothetical protein Ddye_028461 [Dipteronia dyeriana]|uniref:Uncharacterized protein n=1 Tax=Dipteronia dyeriana TaxID=168575 RepID=A0AAD9WRF0_9ROSI|nr:hypothetical protein Ddye_028461 [Dipteronia dyeriana]
MVEIAVSIAAKVAEYLVAPIVRPLIYVWNYKRNLKNLETEVQRLKDRRDAVKHMADEARRNAEDIEENVNNWLYETSKILIEENESANMKCFKGLCPNPKKRYQESKKAVKKAKAVTGLYEEGKFDRISYKTDAGAKQYQAHIQVFMNGNNNNLPGAHIVRP